MSAITIPATLDALPQPVLAWRPDGAQFDLAVHHGGGIAMSYAHGDSSAVAALLMRHDYTDLTEREALEARIRYAIDVQVQAQAGINVVAQEAGMWGRLTQWEREVLNGPRHTQPDPRSWPSRGLLGGAEWTAVVPLVVVATAYDLYGSEVPLPYGNVQVIDPATDEDMLDTMDAAGMIRVYRHDVLCDDCADDFTSA